MSIPNIVDTGFRAALGRLAAGGRILSYAAPASMDLEIASAMKKLDGDKALFFQNVVGSDTPLIGNLLGSPANCETAFGVDYRAIREMIGRAIDAPIAPETVARAPIHDVVQTEDIDVGALLPALMHAPKDAGRYITSGIVVVRDPETGVRNASYHRLQIQGPDTLGIKLDFGRHLRAAYERAQAKGQPLEVAICLGADLALQFTAATMGSQMPESADELAVAGGLSGRALTVTPARTIELDVPAECEYVIEGVMEADAQAVEGPFGEFVGFAAPAAPAPVVRVKAICRRAKPIYHAINGFGRETVVLRKYVLEASLLKVLTSAVPIVVDAEMTVGGMHRFHAVLQVKMTSPQQAGLQRNAILAAFGALKDLDMVIVVDDDIDIRDPHDVEYALATRMEASKDLILAPGARGHEYVRASDNGIRTKLGVDATVPFEEQDRYRRVEFAPSALTTDDFSGDCDALLARLPD